MSVESKKSLSINCFIEITAVKYAHARQLSLPDQLSIIGYNNSILSYCTDPEISSIDTKVEALCTATVNTLMGVFGKGNVPVKTTIAADFIQISPDSERESNSSLAA